MDEFTRRWVAQRFRAPDARRSKVTTLSQAIAEHVQPGDAIHLGMTHSRHSAAFYELVRAFGGTDPGFELHAVQMTSPLVPLVHAGLARKIVTSWAGNSYWTPGPNPIYQRAWADGVAFEHWSILTYAQRLAAGARGLASTTTRSLRGSAMESNPGVRVLDDGDVLIPALVPDVSIFHAPMADHEGNVAFSPPLFEDVSGAFAARRGCIVTVERVVDRDVILRNNHLTRIPASRVLAVVPEGFGAHPGGVVPTGLTGVEAYGEDYEFWVELREASREPAAMDAFVREWITGVADHQGYLVRLGAERLERLRDRAVGDPMASFPPDVAMDAGATPTERAIVAAADVLAERITSANLTAVLAGAGNANLAAWLAAYSLTEPVELVAEMGLVGYWPQPAEPILFNPKNFPTCSMLADIDTTLAILIGGAGARSIGALGAAQVDRTGAINSTEIPGERLLMGSGGANDVITCATETVLLANQSTDRFVERVPYVTGPGDRVSALVSDLGVFRKDQGELVLTALLPGATVEEVRARCGWDLRVAGEPVTLAEPTPEALRMLRVMDPHAWFRS